MSNLIATAAVIDALEELGIEYLVVGALSSNAYGIGRSTHDADIVVDLRLHTLGELIARLGRDYRVERQQRFEGLTGSVHNIVSHVPTGFHIELFHLNPDEHHQQRFRRRVRAMLTELNREVWLPTPEDVVIQKLRWGRGKDVDDVRSIIAVQQDALDWTYLCGWTDRHGTTAELNRIRNSIPRETR